MSSSEVSVRFPVVFGAQHDRPRRNVKVVPTSGTPEAGTPEVGAPDPARPRRRKKARGAPAGDGTPAIPTSAQAATGAPTSRTARSLALATLLCRNIEAGEIRDHAHAAELLGITAANVNYLLNLTYLAADIQEAILLGELVVSERRLRPVARVLGWEEQRDQLQRVQRAGAHRHDQGQSA